MFVDTGNLLQSTAVAKAVNDWLFLQFFIFVVDHLRCVVFEVQTIMNRKSQRKLSFAQFKKN